MLKDKSFGLAINIVQIYKLLTENRREFVMSKQLLRSGTAVGALIREAQNAESKADFVHKLSIAQKECDETMYWLELLHQSNYLHDESFRGIYGQANEVLKMVKSAIVTTKQKYLNK